MKIRYLHTLLYFGLAIYSMGFLFRVQHWPGSAPLYFAGILLLAVSDILIVLEMVTSGKASMAKKAICALLYFGGPILVISLAIVPILFALIAIFLAGTVYLNLLRKMFITTRADLSKKQFDSIQ